MQRERCVAGGLLEAGASKAVRSQASSEGCEAIPWEKSPVIVTAFTARSHPADATHIRPSVGIGASSIGTKKEKFVGCEDEAPFQTTAVHLNFWLVNISANLRGAMPLRPGVSAGAVGP